MNSPYIHARKMLKAVAWLIGLSPLFYSVILDRDVQMFALLYLLVSVPVGLLFYVVLNVVITSIEKGKLQVENQTGWKAVVLLFVIAGLCYLMLRVGISLAK